MSGAGDIDHVHELIGLRADNLLAFLALLGLLRTLTDSRPDWHPRASWGGPPWHARLHLATSVSRDDVAAGALDGMPPLAAAYAFSGHKNIDFTADEFRDFAEAAVSGARQVGPHAATIAAALGSDGALKNAKTQKLQATALCAIFGQGHQNFLERLENLAHRAPVPRDRDTVKRALFEPWRYEDDDLTFRWDPAEDRRYARGFADPSGQKTLTVAGAQRLAVYGFPEFSCAPGTRGLQTVGFARYDRRMTLTWPIWHPPATLDALRALIRHPELAAPRPSRDTLGPMGVTDLMRARRISVGKYMSFERARQVWGISR